MNRSRLRNEIIKELYGTSLRFLYEQAADPTTPDPTAAAAPTPDPTAAATPTPDPAAAAAVPTPVPDPTAAAVPATPGAPAAPAPGAPAAPVKKPAVQADIKSAIGRYLEKAEQKAISAGAEDVEVASVDEKLSRSLRGRSLSFLLEADDDANLKDPDLDIKVYTAEVARLIDDFTSLVDYKKITIDSAVEYLKSHYPSNGESLGKEMVDLLDREYHISLEPKEPQPDHYAKEAGSATGGGGAA
jgi:hypothetical protein